MSRQRKHALGLAELIAVALGGMVGGGIFSILGISVQNIGNATPIAIAIGAFLAFLAAYSYVKLALYYQDEGATYSFFKKTFPDSHFAASVIGWLVVFGYISTLALYAFTFASYLSALFPKDPQWLLRKILAGSIITLFVLVNLFSVKGMGIIEDILVYTKLGILLVISGLLAGKGNLNYLLPVFDKSTSVLDIFIVASITFVAYEGFQLVINAYREMKDPQKNVSKAIYSSIGIACILYIVLSLAALFAFPKELIIKHKEFALAAGASQVLGHFAFIVVIFGALLATSSAISGTLFGSSRLMAVIAQDGYLPKLFSRRIKTYIPHYAIIVMGLIAFVLILTGGLQSILEFGSITFIVVSFLMSVANLKIRKKTKTKSVYAIMAMTGLLGALVLIFYYEFISNRMQLLSILLIYASLTVLAWLYAWMQNRKS
ncbi:MAG: amino acid permease [Deltaproteobacteria bacterium]|nr:amino acid permease [Deltaproteobacteria bacterium]